jgi:hypothetical protein
MEAEISASPAAGFPAAPGLAGRLKARHQK